MHGDDGEGDTKSDLAPSGNEQLLHEVMSRQAALGIRVAAGFVILLIGLPALSHFAPEIAQMNVGGFPFAWFILGIAFFPITWALSYWFVRASDAIEHDIAEKFSSVVERGD